MSKKQTVNIITSLMLFNNCKKPCTTKYTKCQDTLEAKKCTNLKQAKQTALKRLEEFEEEYFNEK